MVAIDDELARTQLEILIGQAREDFDRGLDVDIYGGPIRLNTRSELALDGGLQALAAVADDGFERRVYVWVPAAGTSGLWRERQDLDPDAVEGLISWGESRMSRSGG